jgi:4-hydroxybenzoyl-CoA thioesterase/acyl-CoA thioester hydrolase
VWGGGSVHGVCFYTNQQFNQSVDGSMAYLYQRRVAFADTDAAGWVHFSRLLCYAEEAEHALLSELNIPLLDGGGWPRVHVECDYFAPLKMGNEVEVVLIPHRVGASSVTWQFNMLRGAQDIAKGEAKTVRVNSDGSPSELLPEWRNALKEVMGS